MWHIHSFSCGFFQMKNIQSSWYLLKTLLLSKARLPFSIVCLTLPRLKAFSGFITTMDHSATQPGTQKKLFSFFLCGKHFYLHCLYYYHNQLLMCLLISVCESTKHIMYVLMHTWLHSHFHPLKKLYSCEKFMGGTQLDIPTHRKIT